MTGAPVSKASQFRQAERILRALLKTPKTRAGLIAAVSVKGVITKHFVFGWLAERRRDGTLVVLKSMGENWYQVAPDSVQEIPSLSVYPSWLDPRALPISSGRVVAVDGVVLKPTEVVTPKPKRRRRRKPNAKITT